MIHKENTICLFVFTFATIFINFKKAKKTMRKFTKIFLALLALCCMVGVQSVNAATKKVYATLSLEPKHLEQILEETQMLLSEVISILLKLEMNGFVRETTKNCYIRTQ